ncbi:MAG: hypothetical protein KAS04_02725 [Candidatus Aenigmarchaeota archaeon]|nr:hypothetical protein [Candidatus Aenigmarchaeota archaeon]
MTRLEKISLATLKAVKSLQFNINREVLDSVAYCISQLEASEEKAIVEETVPQQKKIEEITPEEVPDSGNKNPAPVNEGKEVPTREELNSMKYWEIRKKFKITGEKSMKKDELIEMILAQ